MTQKTGHCFNKKMLYEFKCELFFLDIQVPLIVIKLQAVQAIIITSIKLASKVSHQFDEQKRSFLKNGISLQSELTLKFSQPCLNETITGANPGTFRGNVPRIFRH